MAYGVRRRVNPACLVSVSADSEAWQARAGCEQREGTSTKRGNEVPSLVCMAYSVRRCPAWSLYPLTVRHGKHAQDVHKERERSSLSCVHGLQRAQTWQSNRTVHYILSSEHYGQARTVHACVSHAQERDDKRRRAEEIIAKHRKSDEAPTALHSSAGACSIMGLT